MEIKLKEKTLKGDYERQFKFKDEQIEKYKDFKGRQSTKSLEKHCLTQFNSISMTAFPTAYFEKDNDARSGSRNGSEVDFIFREVAEDGTEFISIMFEMNDCIPV